MVYPHKASLLVPTISFSTVRSHCPFYEVPVFVRIPWEFINRSGSFRVPLYSRQ